MRSVHKPRHVCAALAVVASAFIARGEEIGTARVARWKDDKKAAFLLMFDDSWPSHWHVAVPALAARGMTATFYINPGKGEYLKFKDKWENEVWRAGMAYGVHTMTHQGVRNLEHARHEIGECARTIVRIVPGKTPRLLSWAMPGVPAGKWNITGDELKTILAEHHLVERPPFVGHGVVYHLKTAEEMLALADKAIAEGGVEHLIAHGVERGPDIDWGYQDFWAWKQECFHAVLDGLAERRDRGDLWITDHISCHQYVAERGTARVETKRADARRIVLSLTCAADPVLYDHPLTLICTVPAAWRACQVTQGGPARRLDVRGGTVMFDAVPGPVPVEIGPLP